MKKKVLLAFSGGLDTSYCAVHLTKDLGFDVIAASVNTGGFDAEEVRRLRIRALELGVSDYQLLDETENFYQNGISI